MGSFRQITPRHLEQHRRLGFAGHRCQPPPDFQQAQEGDGKSKAVAYAKLAQANAELQIELHELKQRVAGGELIDPQNDSVETIAGTIIEMVGIDQAVKVARAILTTRSEARATRARDQEAEGGIGREPSGSTAPCCLAQLIASGCYNGFLSVTSWALVGVDAYASTKADRFQYHFFAANRTSYRQRQPPEWQSA